MAAAVLVPLLAVGAAGLWFFVYRDVPPPSRKRGDTGSGGDFSSDDGGD
ncbi:hypothetical protein [Streptomyces sp. NPDC058726]